MSDLIGYGATMCEKSRVMVKMLPRVNKPLSICVKQVQAEELDYRGRKIRSSVVNSGV